MRLVWAVALVACSGGAAPRVVTNEERVASRPANDCPSFLLGPWSRELFPACLPWFYGADVPICAGAACARPCASRYSGNAGETRIDSVTTYRYDTRGRFLESIVDGKPTRSCIYEDDRLMSCSQGERPWSVTRDARGRIATMKDAWSTSHDITYDAEGRVVAVGRKTLRYDRTGWLSEIDGQRVEHDAVGHMTSIGSGKDAWTYAYEGDRLVKLTTDMTSATFEYDALGRLHRIRARGRRLPSDLETVYDYDCN